MAFGGMKGKLVAVIGCDNIVTKEC